MTFTLYDGNVVTINKECTVIVNEDQSSIVIRIPDGSRLIPLLKESRGTFELVIDVDTISPRIVDRGKPQVVARGSCSNVQEFKPKPKD